MHLPACATILMALALLSHSALAQTPATTPAAKPTTLPFTISPETTNIIAPLRSDGSVDYVAALNEKYSRGVTADNNGFIIWLRIVGTGPSTMLPEQREKMLSLLGIPTFKDPAATWRSSGYFFEPKTPEDQTAGKGFEEVRQARSVLWDGARFPAAAAYLKSVDPFLKLAVEGSSRPRWWMPYVPDDGRSIQFHNGPLSLGFDLEYSLCARATFEANAGGFNAFLRDVLAVKHLTRHLCADGDLIELLQAASGERIVNESIGVAVGTGRFTQDQCAQLEQTLQTLGPLPPLADSTDSFVRWFVLDVTASIALDKVGLPQLSSDDSDFDASKSLASIDRNFADWNQILKGMNQTMDEMVQCLRIEMRSASNTQSALLTARFDQWEQTLRSENYSFTRHDSESREDYSDRVMRGIYVILRPVTYDYRDRYERQITTQDACLHLLIAAARAKAATGQWPTTQAQLVPAYLKEWPRDIYSESEDAPLKLTVSDNHARAYSVGANTRDDGGLTDRASNKDDIAVGAN